jgi:anthranilate phosphoribosyltransferase
MIKETIAKLVKRIDLSEAEMRAAFEEIMSGEASPKDIELFLKALRDKGETVEEITAAAKVMREKSVRIDIDGATVLDTCGTGGTGINTFNISTAAAFVVAGCGVRIAKHGNRSASGHCGSADVLEALGVKIDVAPETAARCVKDIGIGFLFAPSFHKAMKYAAAPRKAVGGRTIFNVLGPLSNPAGAKYQVIGVYDGRLTETIAGVLKNLGTERAFVVHGEDSLDEITITGRTRMTELANGKVRTYDVSPEDFGAKKASPGDIKGYDAKKNAGIILSVLEGERSARRDIVLMNASAGLVCCGKAKDFKDGIRMSAGSIDSGSALEKLKKLIEMTNQGMGCKK